MTNLPTSGTTPPGLKPPEDRELTAAAQRDRAAATAGMSLLVPGLGQLLQGRHVTGALQFATVVSYAVTTISVGCGEAAWLAVAWNVWSAVDAYWHERRCGAASRSPIG